MQLGRKSDLLNALVDEIFVDRKAKVMEILRDYGLESSIQLILENINDPDNLKKLSDPEFVKSLSFSFLTRINTRIEEISDQSKKAEVEYVIGEIAEHLLIKIIHLSPLDTTIVLQHISDGLKTSCELNSWNFEALNRLIKIELLHGLAAKFENSVPKNKEVKLGEPEVKVISYIWNGDDKDFDDLVYSLKDMKVIKSKVDFAKMFSHHDKPIKLKIHPDKLNFLIILFDELKLKNLISVKGGKAGHFTPLKRYACDLNGEFLIKNSPKHLKYNITRNKKNHDKLIREAGILIKPYLDNTTSN